MLLELFCSSNMQKNRWQCKHWTNVECEDCSYRHNVREIYKEFSFPQTLYKRTNTYYFVTSRFQVNVVLRKDLSSIFRIALGYAIETPPVIVISSGKILSTTNDQQTLLCSFSAINFHINPDLKRATYLRNR